HQAQQQGADYQLRPDPRTRTVASPFDPELPDETHQIKPERHHQQKNQDGNAVENKGLLRIVGTEGAETRRETERPLPHDQRYGKEKYDRAETVKNSLGH